MEPNHLFSSSIGIIHTIIGILALVFGIVALIRQGRIDPANGPGKWYVIFTLASCLSSFLVMKTGHLSPSHFLSVLILIVLPFGIFFQSKNRKGTAFEYVGVVAMSMTLFLSFIPTIVETLTRLPLGHPVASSDKDPVLQPMILVLTIVFVTGAIYQVIKIKKSRKVDIKMS
jgi:uncharacterized membrane protein